MTNLVPASEIENIVGRRRHERAHYGRAVSDEEVFYILHSKNCLEDNPDLRDCEFSIALDNGFNLDYWKVFMDRPVPLRISAGQIYPKLIGE